MWDWWALVSWLNQGIKTRIWFLFKRKRWWFLPPCSRSSSFFWARSWMGLWCCCCEGRPLFRWSTGPGLAESPGWLIQLLLIWYSSSHLLVCGWSSSRFAIIFTVLSSLQFAVSSRSHSPSVVSVNTHNWASSANAFLLLAVPQYACLILLWLIATAYWAIPPSSAPYKAPYFWAAE